MTAPRRNITPEHAELLEQARVFLDDAGTLHAPLLKAVLNAVHKFLDAVRDAVLGRGGGAPDPDQFPTEAVWLGIAHAELDPLIGEAFEAAYLAALDQYADPTEAGSDLFRAEPFVTHHIDTVDSRLRDWPAAVFEEIRHELRQAYAANETTDQMRDRVGAVLKIDAASRDIRDRIQRLGRAIADAMGDRAAVRALKTERAALYRDLREEDQLWQWRANRIARTELTAAVNGGQYRAHITLAAAEGVEPRKQWMCVAGDVPVLAAEVTHAVRRWHEGQLVVIRTASGGRVSVTPQHPVLTGRGWLDAEDVKPGDEVFRVASVDAVTAPEIENGPALIGEVIGSALDRATSAEGQRAVPVVVDFKGDATDGDIQVVRADRDLRARLLPSGAQSVKDLALIASDQTLSELFAGGPCNQRTLGHAVAPISCADSSGPAALDLSAFSGHPEQTGSAHIPDTISQLLTEDPPDGGLRAPITPGQDPLGIAGKVVADDVTGVEVVPFRGHVYDLSTVSGWFVAGSIIVHNSTSDERTRPSHAAANGQVRDLSRPFTIGGAPLMYPGDPSGPAEECVNCRCALVVIPPGTDPVPLFPIGDQTDDGAALAAAIPEATMAGPAIIHATGANPSAGLTVQYNGPPPADKPSTLPAPPRPVPDGWRGVLVPLDTLSCDGRVVATPTGELATRPMPLPLLAQEALAEGHDGAVVVGLIDRAWVQDGAVWGEGRFDLQDEAGRLWARRLGDGFAGWVSVDLDEATLTEMGVDDAGNLYQLADADPAAPVPADDQQIVLRADPWRLMSATLLSQQAFTDARITGLTGYSGPGTGTEIVQAAPLPPTPKDAEDAGADQVWVPSPGERVVVDSGDASGPGEVTEVDTQADPIMVTVLLDAGGQVTVDVAELTPETATAPPTGQAGLIRSAPGRTRLVRSLAAAGTVLPRAEWFAYPRLDAPTPLTVDGDRVFGHLALWSSCHTGIPDVCVTPPGSGTEYSIFHTGEVLCEGGNLVPVGKITLGTGHADMQDGFQAALEHYDNTGTAVAVVRAYEDDHGIVVAGALCPGVTAEQVAALRRSPLSGDWRRIGGNMELVAALCVNVPGFPVPRLAASIGAMGAQTSLVAAGRVPARAAAPVGARPGNLAELVLDSDRYARTLAAAAVDEYVSRNQRRAAAVARMSANGGTVWGRTRAMVAAARLRGDGSEQVIERAAAGHGYRKGQRGGV